MIGRLLVASLLIFGAAAHAAPAGQEAHMVEIDAETLTGASAMLTHFPGKLRLTATGSEFVSHGNRKIGPIVTCTLDHPDAAALFTLLKRAMPVAQPVTGLAASWSISFKREGGSDLAAAISKGSLTGQDPKAWAIFLDHRAALLTPEDQMRVTDILGKAGCADVPDR